MAHKKLTTIIIDALEDIKARDIKLINVSKLTSVFDYLAIASADSTRQTKALAKNVIDKVKEAGGWIYGTEGEQAGEWVLVDCGDVVVHIMQPVVREHYKLEELWGDGKLEFPKPAKAKPARIEAATVKSGAKSKATARSTVVKKKTAAKTGAKKPATTRRKAAAASAKVATAKKPVAKKPAASKPSTRRRSGTK